MVDQPNISYHPETNLLADVNYPDHPFNLQLIGVFHE